MELLLVREVNSIVLYIYTLSLIRIVTIIILTLMCRNIVNLIDLFRMRYLVIQQVSRKVVFLFLVKY